MNTDFTKLAIMGFACLAICGTGMARPLIASPNPPALHNAPTRAADPGRHAAKRSHLHHGGHSQNHSSSVAIVVDNGPTAAELALQREAIDLERQQLEMQKTNSRVAWENETKDRDLALQNAALEANDGKCADYFCGTRCLRRASTGGFCAKHYRELDKGIKDQNYLSAARARFP